VADRELDSGTNTGTNTEIDTEQTYVSMLYEHLDAMRTRASAKLAALTRTTAERMSRAERDTAVAWQAAEVARLDSVQEGLCFGRLDLTDGRTVYIGRIGLFQDTDDEPLLLDWRAPAAKAFYTATAAAAEGVRRRRRITTQGRTVVALNDEVLDADETGGATGDKGLTGDAALLAAVSAGRTGRMHDIVTTLQAEQHRIIRDEHRGVLVVQGGPGTGKTAVALHRVAYLLYTQPHLRTRGVLVVGPSRIFLDYIGQVLPGLGENSVVTSTIAELCRGVDASRTEPPGTAELKGRASMAAELAAAVRARVTIPREPVDLDFEQQSLRLEPDDCRRAVRRARRTGLPHNQARLVFQREIIEVLARRLTGQFESVVLTETGEALDGGDPDGRLSEADLRALGAAGVVVDLDEDTGPRTLLDETDAANLRDTLLADSGLQSVLDTLWPSLTPQDLLPEPVEGWSTADIPLLDEAAALVGQSDGRATFGHVIVDEAQELSEMAWRMLMRRCPSRSMTIVGDLAQTGDPAGTSSWDRVLEPHVHDRWHLAELTVNYRTPAEIMAAAAPLLAAYHPGIKPPQSIRSTGTPPWRLRTTLAELPGTVAELAGTDLLVGRLAIIAPSEHISGLAAVLSLGTQPDLTDEVVLLTAGQAKGLEFDSVLIADPAAILAASAHGHNDLYVAMTRATQRLGIVHPGPPPAELAAMRDLAGEG
jgi:DNA helicase IV